MTAAPAVAADPKREARLHHERAVRHYDLGEFREALERFKEAYRLSDDPSFLFNIGQCHRKLGQLEESLHAFRRFVQKTPDASARANVEKRIRELEDQLADRKTAARAAPEPAGALPAAPVPPAPSPLVETSAPRDEAPETPPVYQRWWFWTAIGAALVAGGVAAVMISRGGGATPYCGEVRPCPVTLK